MQSVTDTKELIPEFFYLPEFLENREGLSNENCHLSCYVALVWIPLPLYGIYICMLPTVCYYWHYFVSIFAQFK